RLLHRWLLHANRAASAAAHPVLGADGSRLGADRRSALVRSRGQAVLLRRWTWRCVRRLLAIALGSGGLLRTSPRRRDDPRGRCRPTRGSPGSSGTVERTG